MLRWGEDDRDYLNQWPTAGLLRQVDPATERAMLGAVRNTVKRSGAQIERLDLLRLPAPAWALVVRVDEPHAFLRHRLRALLDELDPIGRRASADYVEVRDDRQEAAFVHARMTSGTWGMAGWSARRDLKCCAPEPRGFGGGIDMPPPPPPCPVFD
jgi:hypothetical protein